MKNKLNVYIFIHFLSIAFLVLLFMVIIVNLDKTNLETYSKNLLIINYIEILVTIVAGAISGISIFLRHRKITKKIASLKDFELIFNGLAEGLVIIGYDKNILFVSNNLEEITGYSKEEIASLEPLNEIDSRELREDVARQLSGENKEGSSHTYYIFHKKKLKNAYVEVKVEPIEINDINSIAIIISDITDSIEKNKDLVGRLSKAEKTAKNTNDFMSRVSHEIRTPLNGVIGMNEIAIENIEKNDLESAKEALYKVDFSAKYLLSILNDVLDIAKIENGKMVVDQDIFSLSVLLDEIKIMFSSATQSKNIDFKTLTNFDDLNIITDKTKFTQILVNFVSNAIKYTQENGHVTLMMNRTQLYSSKVKLDISIKDDGIGMSEDFVKKMFEPFSQERRYTSSGGTGLGLAITKSMISLLNGSIEVVSEINKGTEIKMSYVFDISLANEVEKTDDNYLHQDYSKFRVLVAEDNDINSLIIVNHLKYFNFKIETAFNGEDAYNKYINSEEGYYDFILMDIQMPIMNGYEATHKIRESKRKDNDLIIIALTADSFKDDISKAIMNKMNQHITKPIDRNKMIETIYQQLKIRNLL